MHSILHYLEKKYVRHACKTGAFLTHFRSRKRRIFKALMQQKGVDQDRKWPGKCIFKFHDFS